MWYDPLDAAVQRGENLREAERLGITLEELLHQQYLESIKVDEDKKQEHISWFKRIFGTTK